MKSWDVVVVGGGTAGTAAAKAAAAAGARTAMLNDGELGGLCILRGCMPTKTMLHAAHLAHDARQARTPGVRTAGVTVDFAALMANKDAKVARFKAAKVRSIEGGGYAVIDARARFVAPDAVEAGGELHRFQRGAVIAVGSVTSVPDLPGLADVPYLTSDDVMRLEAAPRSLVVLGSGAVGLELGQFFARIGTRVTLVTRRPVYADADPLVAEEMAAALADEPDFELRQPVAVTRVERGGPGVRVHLADGTTAEGEALLLATGRRPALDGLGLEAAGIPLEGGRAAHGDDMGTANPRVWIAGDASGDRLILHVANQEGRAAGLNAARAGAAPRERVDRRLDTWVVFTDPPMARVGMNEREARAAGLDPLVARARYAETGRAITMDVAHGGCALVADRATGELLGAQLLGPRADDLVHQIAAIMYYRGTAAHMLDMPWYHPTVSEVFLSLARDLAARTASAS